MQTIRNIRMGASFFGVVLLFFIWGGFNFQVHSGRQREQDNVLQLMQRANGWNEPTKVYQSLSLDGGPMAKQAQKKELLVIQEQMLLKAKNNAYQLRGEYVRDFAASRGVQRGRQVTLEATGYTCGPESTGKYPSAPDYCQTASGYRLRPGDKVVAMGKKYPFGTTVVIPGYGLATVRDRGGAVTDNHIDLYFERVEDALKWVRRRVTVTVL